MAYAETRRWQQSTSLQCAPTRKDGHAALWPHVGFTPIELMPVVIVVGILAMLATSAYQSYRDRVAVARAVFDIGHTGALIGKYQLDNRAFPDGLGDIGESRLLDPWSNPYQYVNHDEPGTRGLWRRDKNIVPINSDFDVFRMGKDGASRPPRTAARSGDDIVRANNGAFVGLASVYDP